MILRRILPLMESRCGAKPGYLLRAALALGIALAVSACSSKEEMDDRVLVRVNGQDITMLQVNDELRREGIKADQQEAATKQAIESLIDRQLLADEAVRHNIQRTPEVTQATERAKAQIIVHAYLKRIESRIARPSTDEIYDYFRKHPEYFAQRKQYSMQKLVIATKEFSSDLKSAIATAASLDAVATWLDRHNIRYARGQFLLSTADLPERLVGTLTHMKKDQLFTVNEGDNSVLLCITAIRDTPVGVRDAALQIEQYLINRRTMDAVEAEISHLRSKAKIEYLTASAAAAHSDGRDREG